MHITPPATEDFLYLKQILFSQNMLTESEVRQDSHIPFFYMNVTAFAEQFKFYIREGNQ
jgi:hypothetical protein